MWSGRADGLASMASVAWFGAPCRATRLVIDVTMVRVLGDVEICRSVR